MEDVNGWVTTEQPSQVQRASPDFDGGSEIGGPAREDLGVNEEDDDYYNNSKLADVLFYFVALEGNLEEEKKKHLFRLIFSRHHLSSRLKAT
ncbi:hypothetical protein MRB53_026322 [Persea americana]|uniref:Uncharacterized protein n=1 Tax=Persea americana TaxID=3435 RepID=A0ACC2LHT5_PERAE|nr:hypothetical protein MRB53_026322 [Persea americana]